MDVVPYDDVFDSSFDPSFLDQIILELGDMFNIRIAWNRDTTVITGICTVAGGLLGGYTGGRVGAAIGMGVGGAAGLGVSTMVTLRELWVTIKEQVKELLYIVYNYLQRQDPENLVRAFHLLMACHRSRVELGYTMIDFIAIKLGRQVTSYITSR